MPQDLHRDAIEIWAAGVEAVRSASLVERKIRVEGSQPHGRRLVIGEAQFDLESIGRILVVGAGKAGAGMAEGLEQALGESLMAEKNLTGWINVPADCVRPLGRIHLHSARPAGVNEPTLEGVEGAREIMRRVGELQSDDLCIVLVSGGGSALLPLPIDDITLADKQAVTRYLSGAGAPIEALNIVRTCLSKIKGGGLARACGANRLVTLIISDVLGDPIDLIASGPTVEATATARQAREILAQYEATADGISARVFKSLDREGTPPPVRCQVMNFVIANNRTAVNAACRKAEALGYRVRSESARHSEPSAEEVGCRLAEAALRMRADGGENCLVSGGEPTVKLVPAQQRGLGGRNMQLVLAAAERLAADDCHDLAIVSGGTDGEDGPTDAAGAWLDARVVGQARALPLDPRDFLMRNDAYHWFEPLNALLKTGPTDTNVCDLRVVLVDRA
jgi:glycerate 2-kinase